MSADLLEVRGLSVAYDGADVLGEIDLSVAAGEVVALLGPRARARRRCCTRSLGRARLGPERCGSGDGWSPAMVFQNYALWPHLSALETVAIQPGGGESRSRARAQTLEILKRLHVATWPIDVRPSCRRGAAAGQPG